jgi:hypothetical protein
MSKTHGRFLDSRHKWRIYVVTEASLVTELMTRIEDVVKEVSFLAITKGYQ